MKNPPPMMTEKMPTTKPPTRSAAVSRVSSQGASALIHERSITVLHPDAMARAAADFLGIGKESSGDGTEGNLRLIRELVNSARRGSDYPDSRPANSDRASPVVPLLEGHDVVTEMVVQSIRDVREKSRVSGRVNPRRLASPIAAAITGWTLSRVST